MEYGTRVSETENTIQYVDVGTFFFSDLVFDCMYQVCVCICTVHVPDA